MRLSANEQAALLRKIIKIEREKLAALPPAEAKKLARKNLFDAGIVDEAGNYTEPYSALRGLYV